MGAIQSSINQLIGSGAVIAGLYAHTPEGQAAGEKRILKQQEKGLTRAASSLINSSEYSDPNLTQQTSAVSDEIMGRLQENRSAQFYNNPTAETLRRYVNTRRVAEPTSNVDIFNQSNQRAGSAGVMQGQQAEGVKDRKRSFTELTTAERREFLRWAQHYQSIQKRGDK